MTRCIGQSNVVWREGKYFVAQSLGVDMSSFGKSREDAIEQLAEALALYFEDVPSEPVDR
jgi:predicted RNase H-like HicB family nuclease